MRNEEEKDNVIVFPGCEKSEVRKDIHDLLPRGYHRVHYKLAPHITHFIIIGACATVLGVAALYGIHEGIVHHIAVAIIAERVATMGIARE